MKLSYYGYAIEQHSTQNLFLHDIRGLLRCFSRYPSADYKAQFTHLGEHVYLVHVLRDTFLFVITRNQEIIKRIRTSDLTISEIQELLRGDSIGFASYVYIRPSFFGFASTAMAPRCSTFCSMVTDIFRTLGLEDYLLRPYPLMTQATRDEATRMNFIGETLIRVEKDSTLANHLKAFFHIDDDDFDELGGIDVTFKPRRRRDITGAARRIINQVPDDGLNRFVVKAKNYVGETLQELWLMDKGQLSDSIFSRTEPEIIAEIEERANQNDSLREKVREHEGSDEFAEVDDSRLARFRDASAWTRRLMALHPPD